MSFFSLYFCLSNKLVMKFIHGVWENWSNFKSMFQHINEIIHLEFNWYLFTVLHCISICIFVTSSFQSYNGSISNLIYCYGDKCKSNFINNIVMNIMANIEKQIESHHHHLDTKIPTTLFMKYQHRPIVVIALGEI
jgi:hypothetical protein